MDTKKHFLVGCMLVVLFLAGCGRRQVVLVRIGETFNGYLLVTNVPVPSNPENAANIDFEYVGQAFEGEECLVFSAVEIYGELVYEVGCKGLSQPGYLPATSVIPLKYAD